MGAALGLDAQARGRRRVARHVGHGLRGLHARRRTTPSGFVAGFADATGHFLPLVCTLNAARVLTSTADLLGVDFDGLAALALAAEPGSGGLTLLPYLDGERTPNLPDARGSLHGMTRANLTPANLARAAIEGMFGGLADAVDALVGVGVEPRRILLIGGAAANPAVGAVAATMFAAPIVVPPPGEYVADGAARQAAWVLSGAHEAPAWPGARPGGRRDYEPAPVPAVREAYADARTALYSGLSRCPAGRRARDQIVTERVESLQ